MEKTMYVITVDALSIQYVGNKEELEERISKSGKRKRNIGEGFSISHSHKKKASFNKTCNIYIDNELLGQVYHSFNSKWRYSNPNVVLFEIENNMLYQLDWPSKIRRMEKLLRIEFLKYDYMEIAIDGIGIVTKQNKFTFSSEHERCVSFKKGVKMNYNEKQKSFDGNVLGSRYSDKYITIYDKISEILYSGKEYIRRWWELAGMDTSKSIERCELRLKAKELGNVDRWFERLEEPNYLAQIFKEKAGRYLEFYLVKRPKNRVSVIDWSYYDVVQKHRKLNKTKKAIPIKRYQNTLRCLFELYSVNLKLRYLYTLADLSISIGLGDWVKKRLPRWIKENRLK